MAAYLAMEAYPRMRVVVVLCLVGMVVALGQMVPRALLPAVAVKLRIRMNPVLAVELKLA
jgi:hypothetical protein